MLKKTTFFLLVLLFTFPTLTACAVLASIGQEATPEADTNTKDPDPTRTPIPAVRASATILAEGALTAVNPPMPLGFITNGSLLELNVKSGDTVSKGDLIAALDDEKLQDALNDTALAVRQAENSLAQAQLSLDKLENWDPDESAVAQAEASLAAAEAGLDSAQSQDSVAYSSITSARVQLEQAQRNLDRANDEYTTAYDPGREWELYIDDPSCRTGEEHPFCTGEPYSDKIKRERDWVIINLANSEDQLEVAQANYNIAVAGLNTKSAVGAEANIASAQQALNAARTGPKQEDIDAARLQVEQAKLSLDQAQLSQERAEKAMEDSRLFAPWSGTILSVDSAPGSFVGAGTPVVTIQDTETVQFQTSNFSERDLAQLTPGQTVVVTLKAYPNDPLDGEVHRVAPIAQGTIGDAATFTVIIDLKPTDLDLLPGMTGRVEINSD